MGWSPQQAGFGALAQADQTRLAALPVHDLPAGQPLFHAGDAVQGYAVVLSGRVDVSLTGASGREMLLYSVEPGQSCVQTTMGLLSDTPYSAEAQTACPTALVILPRALFTDLMDRSAAFRTVVFGAFSARMQTMMALLEKLAFTRVECRLAERLLLLGAQAPVIQITHADLATQVGTAREVVSRRLDLWARQGIVDTGRGTIRLIDTDRLSQIAAGEM